MSAAPAPEPIGAAVTSADVAANLRVISVRLEGVTYDAEHFHDLLGRIDTIVRLFIEKHWEPPRRMMVIQPLSYVLIQGPNDPSFGVDVEMLRKALERRLFGEGDLAEIEVKCLVGPRVQVEPLAGRSEQAFLAAHEAVLHAVEPDAAEPPRAPRATAEEEEGAEPPPAARAPRRPAASDEWLDKLELFAGYDAPKKAVLCYVASLVQGDAPVLFEDFVATTGVGVEPFEHAALRFAADRVLARARSGAICYCLTPLSYESLADRRRREAWLELGGELHDLARRYIVPSIFGGPATPASSTLMDLVGSVRGAYRLIDWRTRTCAVDAEAFKHAGLFAVTLVPPQREAERAIELARLPELVRKLTLLRIRPGFAGVADRSELEAALAAGAHYLAGPAVSGAMRELEPLTRITPGSLPLRD